MTPRTLVRRLGLSTLALGLAFAVVGCKGVDKSQRSQRTVKASIGTFDENADIELAIGDDGGGGERPDDYSVQQAFSGSYEGLDACVAAYKSKKKIAKKLAGEVEFAVKLSGTGKPAAVNATISSAKLDKEQELKDCIRNAVGNTEFPRYDGPNIVAKFTTTIDTPEDEIWED